MLLLLCVAGVPLYTVLLKLFYLKHRYPWGSEAIQKAKAEDKPIFLSVGYSTCHWCHVMERESFESEAVAEVLNKFFISIKVDREERPDVDRVYMTFVQVSVLVGCELGIKMLHEMSFLLQTSHH